MSDEPENLKLDSSTPGEVSSVATSYADLAASLNTIVGAATTVLSTTTDEKNNGLCHQKTRTCSETVNDRDEMACTSLGSLRLVPHKIHLYVLRDSRENDKFVIQAIFSSTVKLNFEPHKVLNLHNGVYSFVHRLTLDLTLTENDGWLYPMDEYHLRLSSQSFRGSKHFVNERRRFLSDSSQTSHQFLFDTDFSDYNFTKAPGKGYTT